jgi:tetratricopeptide (TPR) repeat protein
MNKPLPSALAQELTSIAELMRQQDFHNALPKLKLLQQSYPDDVMVNGLLASAYAELKMFDKAEQQYSKLLELDSSNALARFQYGMLFYNKAEHQKALDIWNPLLEINEEFICKFFASQAYHAIGNDEHARDVLQRCIDAMPADHDLLNEALAFRQSLFNGPM